MSLGRHLLWTASRGSRTSVVPQTMLCVSLCVGLQGKSVLCEHAWCRRTRSMATVPSLEFAQRHVSKGITRLSEDIIEKGEGSWITFRSGRTALDFTCGIGVTNLGTSSLSLSAFFAPRFGAECGYLRLGHCHPKVSKAAAEQCLNLVHGQVKRPPCLAPRPSHLSAESDRYRVSWALSAAHRTPALYHAAQIARLVFLRELGLRGS